MNGRTILAVALGGVAGTLVNNLALVVLVNPDLWRLLWVPGRYAVAIALMIAVPFFYRRLPGLWGAVVALVFLTVAPSLIAKFALGLPAAWTPLLAFNFIYALAALVAYRLVLGKKG